ncbi:toprim domain-containing protein [Clostridium formicaceticum]|uniref:DNA topoisomerase (ATP-hydrolyzing) n=1 Tax=Clostridium formicaceticum TaxID=1497 RepID=A0AAC9RMD7_9CLOT|nr:toprim domain-containing protein [Clostridium formicaceticum]AOY77111.1 DNA topoisomerase [Clostridium formicaceticum]ARE87623.1 DNA gyrase subunit B [Clostridium formicaceticum]
MTTKKQHNYDNDSLSTLQEKDKVRLRPGVIFGSDGIEGCCHTLVEIVANARDEAQEGFGDLIEVFRYKDKSIEVRDQGRGIPLEYNTKEEKYNWEIVFTILYGGGKYNNNTGSNYQYSIGLNGLGTAATQFASEYMDVEVYRDGHRYQLHFEKGEVVGALIKEKYNYQHTGTTIKWKPDLEVFNDIDIPLKFFQEVLKRQAIVNKGITFKLYDEATEETFVYYYENGIIDYVKEVNEEKGFTEPQYFEFETKGRDREDKEEYKLKIEVAFVFNNERTMLEYYHNSSFLEYGGAPDKAVDSGFSSQIHSFIKDKNKYTKNEKRVTFTDIKDSLILVTNTYSTITSYENQTKKAITNKFIQEAITTFLKEKLEIYFIENQMDLEKIIDQILINKRSREKAELTRIDVRKKLSKGVDNFSNKVKKFVDCRSKDIAKRELFIVEGDSALGSTKMGRDAEFQAIIPVRGKILNCLKSDYDKIFKNDIIVDLLKVLGCGVEIKNKHSDLSFFDIEKLNWSKVIICTDADVDGFQIRTLILTMLYVLTPTLIEKGYVYIAESPLYEITDSKGNPFFVYSEGEKNTLLKKLKSNYKIQRSKGLGENEPEMMWQTTMNPETRRLIQVTPTEAQATKEAFELFLGDNLLGRKEFISKYGSKYIDQCDVI